MIQVLLSIVVILLAARIGGSIAKKLGQSAVVGEIIAGLLVGPFVLGKIYPIIIGNSYPVATTGEVMELLANLGVAFLLFLIGLRINLETFERFLKSGAVSAAFGVFIPFVFGLFLGARLGWTPMQSIFLGGALMATSIGVTARILQDLRKVKTKAGLTIIDSAIVEGIITVVALTFLVGLAGGAAPSITGFIFLSLKIVIFFIVVVLIGQKIADYIVKTGEYLNLRVREGRLSMILILLFSFSYLAELIGLNMIIGAFLAGVILSEEKIGGTKHEIYAIGYGLLIPIFFALIGTLIDPVVVYNNIILIAIISIVAIITKIFGASIGAIISGHNLVESAAVGVGMIPRGEVAIVLAGFAVQLGIFNVAIYSTILAVFVVTMLVTPPLLKVTMRKVH